MKIKMELLTDAIFGNGMSIPGGEDISVLRDADGFPYYKGGTFKGIFREELIRYLNWICDDQEKNSDTVKRLLGEGGSDADSTGKLVFSDFCLSENVRYKLAESIDSADAILDALTHIRTFTKISDNGIAEEGTLRNCRCVNKGLYFYSELLCDDKDRNMICEVFSLIKWVGSMRNRGFGKVRITEVK